jgi:hypothetical protein
VDVDAFEREMMARLDAEMATMREEGLHFQRQIEAVVAAWQPIPPQMYSQYADGLESWIAYLRQGAGPAADWLARAGRPAMGRLLAAVIDDLAKAIPGYRQLVGQQVAHMNALGQIQTGMYRQQAASQREIGQIQAATTREINANWAAAQAARTRAFDQQVAQFRRSL